MLRTEQAGLQLQGRRVLAPMDLSFSPGTLHAIFGPNGAGKSSLLRLLAREWPCSEGRVLLEDQPLDRWPIHELARRRAMLPQHHALTFPFLAHEVVALGRLHAARGAAAHEREIVGAALAACGATALATRSYAQLSGGERARVQFARVLAQIWLPVDGKPRYLLLDEPTAHLDLAFQHACLALARDWAHRGACVIAVLHDPSLVLAYADVVSVLDAGTLFAQGSPAAVLTPALMHSLYGLSAEAVSSSNGVPSLIIKAAASTGAPPA